MIGLQILFFCEAKTKFKVNVKLALLIYEEQVFNVGQDTFVDSTAENNKAVIFEDDDGLFLCCR